jgi:hypothetical protein
MQNYWQPVAQISINNCCFEIILLHVEALDGHLQGELIYKEIRFGINVVEDVL